MALRRFASFDRVLPSKSDAREQFKVSGECRECGSYQRLRKNGKLFKHADESYPCFGGGLSPRKVKVPCVCGKPIRVPLNTRQSPRHNSRPDRECIYSQQTVVFDEDYRILFFE